MRLKDKEERGEVSNEMSVNTVPWAPNSLDLNKQLNTNKPTVVFQNEDGSISKAEVQRESDVINEVNNGNQLLQKPEEEKKNDDEKEKNDDKEEEKTGETKKIIAAND